MKIKSLVALLLAFALCVTGMIFALAEENTNYALGDTMEDFAFTTYDGNEYTLYGLLEEKQAVLITFWATWCGPCRGDFPLMNVAYEVFRDKVEVVALSTEAEDTNEAIADFAATCGMTFLAGRDETGLYNAKFNTGGIPTSVLVDRNGVICFFEVGYAASIDAFIRLFETYVGDDYSEPVLLTDGIPAKVPDIAAADPADLAAAIGGEGVTFVHPADKYNWPLIIVSDGERDYAVSTNRGLGGSTSSLEVHVTAAAGDALAMDYKVSSEAGYDCLTVLVNGEIVQQFSGECDWSVYAYAFPADGDYIVTLAYIKDDASDSGDDAAYFDNVRLVTGSEAAELLVSISE